jgi:hypothetical protein
LTTQIVTTEVLDLARTKAPALPIAPVDYSRQYLDQLNNVLRLYFSQLDNFIAQLNAGATSTVTGLRLPYGAFQDSTTQTAANTTTAYPITFNTTDFSNGVTMVSGSRFTVANAGIYNLQFSVQLSNSVNATEDIDIWFRKNGTDIPASNSRFGLAQRKDFSNPFHIIAGLNYFVDMQANDYVQLVWCTSNVDANIKNYAAGTSPTRPSIPSVIATMTFVSALPT